jgi:hypothetical protein
LQLAGSTCAAWALTGLYITAYCTVGWRRSNRVSGFSVRAMVACNHMRVHRPLGAGGAGRVAGLHIDRWLTAYSRRHARHMSSPMPKAPDGTFFGGLWNVQHDVPSQRGRVLRVSSFPSFSLPSGAGAGIPALDQKPQQASTPTVCNCACRACSCCAPYLTARS